MRVARGLAILLALCLLLVASAAGAQSGAGPQELSRPRLMLSPQRLERLKVLAKGRSPQWRRLLSWALEPARQAAHVQDGPGLALAALLNRDLDAKQAAGLGRWAVACALSGAPLGQAQGVSPHLLSDAKRLGSGEKLLEAGYRLVNPRLGQDRVWPVARYTPQGVMVESSQPSLAGAAKAGDTYALLLDDVLQASRVAGEVALILDWAWDWFSPQEREGVASWLVAQGRVFAGRHQGCFDRQSAAALRLVGLAGMAAQGLHPAAQALSDQARQERFQQAILPCLRGAGQGGAWFEGSHAGAAAGLDLLEYVAALKSVTGEDLTALAPWFSDRLAFLVQHLLPGAGNSPRGGYYRLMPDGDQVLGEEEASDLVRLQMLLLAALRPGDTAAGWARALLLDRRTPKVINDHYLGLEFLWLDPDAPLATWTAIPLSHQAQGSGRAFSRSDWSDLATWVGFSCGPHFSAAQHLDAGSLLIFKRGMLLGRSGAYDGPATAHRLNYALRTLAHNTVVVHDAQEYSWYDLGEGVAKRGAYANDGGQRALAVFDNKGQPQRSAPWTASGWEGGPASWEANRDIYDRASLDALEDQPRFAYMRGTATSAYQGSTAKVSRLVRHVLHLRGGGPDDAEAAEAVVVLDDLEVARPDSQGRQVLHFPARPESAAPLVQVGPGRWRGASPGLTFKGDASRLEVTTLLPAQAQLQIFGEAGTADSWVGERNYPPGHPAVNPMPWRAEFAPGAERGRQQPLLMALLPKAEGASPSPPLQALASPDPRVAGVVIADQRWPRWVVLRLGQPQADAVVSYEFGGGDSRHLVAGLAPGTSYSVTVAQGRVTVAPGAGLSSSQAGVLAFRLAPGAD